ncbi:MAG TPA: hypothetical protein DEV87_00805 [Clostridiales bacterium]|nr:hypothetical protein [Clostridiales bacterium]
MAETVNNDRIELIGRKRLNMSGVETVDGFTENSLKLTVAGNKLFICGEKIKITAFNKATGALSADGVFTEIKYAAKKQPLIKRLFK